MPDYAADIKRYFEQPGGIPLRVKELSKVLNVRQRDLGNFQLAVDGLVEIGTLLQTPGGLIRPAAAKGLVLGSIRRNARGNGTFYPKLTGEDATPGILPEPWKIFSEDMAGAITGDTVLAQLAGRRSKEGGRTGRVIEIVERATNTFVGIYFERRNQGFVQVDAAVFTVPIPVGDPGAKGAKPDDKVVIELLQFPSEDEPGQGVITRVLGPRGEPDVDTLSVIFQFGLPDEFPETVQNEARLVATQFSEAQLLGRVDLTQKTIVTIDPIDARDFDDAISLEKDEQGNWVLGVHIADVSHFVRPGTELDHEAKRRGNSVYLPRRVLPMLPEVISNGLASLQQDHVRYTKTAFITYSPEGTRLHAEFANTAIKVTQRFAYEQVMPLLNNEPGAIEVSAAVKTLLQNMMSLAMTLRKRRFAKGALELDMPEVKLDLGDNGKVSGAHRTEYDESHQLIEEFMLAANVATAEALFKSGTPFLRRAHASPDEKKLDSLAKFAGSLGFNIKNCQSREDLQKILKLCKDSPNEYAVSFALLRSMKQATYTSAIEPHYALAEEHYCHFTSPIRRYPDLTIHRQLDDLIARQKVKAIPEIETVGLDCSQTERRAEQAEREVIKIQLLRYAADNPKLTLHAFVTGVERFGLFCQGIEIPLDGLLPIAALPDDRYDYDKTHHLLSGRRSGREFRLGDRLTLQLAKIDLAARELEFKLARKPRPGQQQEENRDLPNESTTVPSDTAAGESLATDSGFRERRATGGKLPFPGASSGRVRTPKGGGKNKGGGKKKKGRRK